MHEAFRKLADGGGAEGQQGVGDVCRVALEIAAHGAVASRGRELIMLQREVVEPDRGIAMGVELALDGGRLIVAGVDAGEIGITDHFLVFLEPRHMGIAEDRDAVGLQLRRLLRGSGDTLHRLGGEAVHEVEVHACEARLAQEFVGGLDEAEGLQPVDLHLHRGCEILDAEADAVEAHAVQHPGAFARQRAGVRLERHLAIRGQP